MELRLRVVYNIDDQEIWLERVFENLQPPAYLRVGDVIEISCSDSDYNDYVLPDSASFIVLFFEWYMPENQVTIHLEPENKPKNCDEFWKEVKAFLSDDWKVCEGTADSTLDELKNKGYTDKIID